MQMYMEQMYFLNEVSDGSDLFIFSGILSPHVLAEGRSGSLCAAQVIRTYTNAMLSHTTSYRLPVRQDFTVLLITSQLI